MDELFFQVIASSSSGNCAILRANGLNILIDAGITLSQMKKSLESINLGIEDIHAIFITHAHTDHYSTLPMLEKYKNNFRVFASEETFEFITYKETRTKSLQWTLFNAGDNFDFENLKISTKKIPHDTAAVSYKIDTGKKSFVWLTDLGKPTESVKETAKSANVLVLESNYCPKKLAAANRPMRTKDRISGPFGHLSNADAISILETLNPDFVERIFLAHVSKECNSVEHIAELISVLPQKLLEKIEIVCPHTGSKSPYRA